MVDADDLLLDDRALIEFFRDKMGGGSDDLHAALPSLMIGLGTDKGG